MTNADRCSWEYEAVRCASAWNGGAVHSVGEAIVATQSDIEELQKGVAEQQP